VRTWFVDAQLDTIANEPSAVHRYGPLPSTFSVRALGAIERLLSGESATRSLRARAVSAHERWAPGEETFAAGLADFLGRHTLSFTDAALDTRGSDCARASNLRRALVMTARKLILTAKAEAAWRMDGELESDDTDDGAADLRLWDPDRVVRHLERGVLHGYQLLQRARWLCLLYDSAVVFREPSGEEERLLLVRGGQIIEARDLPSGDSIPRVAPAKPLCDRQGTFDRNQYDRLRTLTSELKRVTRDGGTASVRVGRGRWVRGSELDALLLWV
jgi:hypothetical protein